MGSFVCRLNGPFGKTAGVRRENPRLLSGGDDFLRCTNAKKDDIIARIMKKGEGRRKGMSRL